MKVALAGPGAFGKKHLDSLSVIDDVECEWLIGDDLDATRTVADQYGIANTTQNLIEALAQSDVEAVILATPTPLHASQAMACLNAGKHVQIEIPLAESIADAQAIVALQRETGLVAMCGHTRRFNPSHQWINQRIQAGELALQQLQAQTFFFRRQNINAAGEPRSWTDHLLWHHAAHTVDLFAYQTGENIVACHGMQGSIHPELGIAMDMSIQLKTNTGKLCSLSLSFNNEGPLGTTFRYICDHGTFIARYDELVDGHDRAVDLSNVALSNDGIELQDREFFSAIREGREPNASVAQVLACYQTLAQIEQQL